ncbi:MAG: methyltransferase domain-containing protein [Chitinophagaceae bacterium]|nr:methyltransferase domain-containing protein [Chitinophagaceae bacterium]
MNKYLIDYLRCSLCKNELTYLPFATGQKGTNDSREMETDGCLRCSCGMIFPIIGGVPRLLPESFLDYETVIEKNIPGYHIVRSKILASYKEIIDFSTTRNRSIKQTFGFEWSLLQTSEQVNVWDLNDRQFEDQLWNELKAEETDFKNATAIDVGCGHGRSGMLLAEKCSIVFCLDIGRSVEHAAKINSRMNCIFIQADLNHLPFANGSFDIVYSSGVLHHNPDTKAAFSKVSALVKKGGILCVWLYKPFHNSIHKVMLGLRNITTRLPLKLQFWLYFFTLLPIHKIMGLLKGKSKSWREIMINQLDMLSPKYRHEHAPYEVEAWFKAAMYTNVEMTTTNNYGFSMRGTLAEDAK